MIERLLLADIEAQLAVGASAQFPLDPDVKVASRTQAPESLKVMNVDFESAAAGWDKVSGLLAEEFGNE